MAPSSAITPGQRLLATVVDNLATSSPTKELGVIPMDDGFKTVSASELSDAVNAMAWWIEEHVGKVDQPETIAFMGATDIRYLVFVLACHKTGYKPLLISTRLSDAAYEHLLTALECKKFAYTKETERRVSEIREFREGTAFFEVPEVKAILKLHGSISYPWSKTYTQAENEVALIIHSSGTTGMPKPVPLTHGFFATIDNVVHLPIPKGRQFGFFSHLGADDLVLSTTPFFHLMGFIAFIESIFHNVPFTYLPDKPLSVELLNDAIKKTKPKAAILPPSVLEDMSQTETGIEALKSLDYVYFGGAPLAPETGARLSNYTQLISVIGSSEMGLIPSLIPEGQGNWNYFEWNEEYGVKMEHLGEGLHELVIPRREDSRAMHAIFHTFPDKSEYRSNDLFVQHPENPKHWKFHGRLDDVVVLSNGEKLNPVTLEKIVEDHPKVHRALLIGQNRFQTSLLVEPVWPEDSAELDETAFIDEIWPVVEKANEAVPKYGRIVKNKIRLSDPNKPFKLTPKGTTQRHAVNKDYSDEIEAIYSAANQECQRLPATIDQDSLATYVRQIVYTLIGREDIQDDDDFYSIGLDSLATIELARILKSAVSFQHPEAQTISPQQIYRNSTVSRLAQFIHGILTGQTVTTLSRVDRINNMIAKYTTNLRQRSEQSLPPPRSRTVILTGSSGSLGTYLLSALLNDSNIEKIYCFNRSDAKDRQIASFEEKGLDAGPLNDNSRVEFLQVSFGDKQFGLSVDKYTELANRVQLILHNAWAVNFNIPLDSFTPHVRGVSEFINFSISSKYNAHLAFVSSVGTIGAWTPEMGPSVPEIPLETPDPVLEQGYAESKHVAERMCLEASRKAGVPTTIFRVGQIAGPTTEKGAWNTNEWIPTLVATSKALRKVPATLGAFEVDWIPVDTLAEIMIELLDSRRNSEELSAFFHLMNPSKTAWSSIVPAVEKAYGIPSVPLEEWISELVSIENPSEEEVQKKPALKLLDFYRGLAAGKRMLAVTVDTRKTQEGSATMADLAPIDQRLMGNWIQQWSF
ncbi:conserved hypothetical protein [Aspergillus terreus NIH2624]|uniref:Carrier domain-containing protein n=1 Tax=Aspergillus terreus (strain NIH 2624 / FGSC A1156) TaxID=341663 RepID=Q0CAZ2_ASPTN|nr:uncharacterized protein ATEG_09142 [Aspergillus terreus NIH2624]EAU30279.1 conserved hypothetical protein [Aspergillus terreus NIH2624]